MGRSRYDYRGLRVIKKESKYRPGHYWLVTYEDGSNTPIAYRNGFIEPGEVRTYTLTVALNLIDECYECIHEVCQAVEKMKEDDRGKIGY